MKKWTTKSGVEIHRVLAGRCNCYLVSKENRFLLVDAGGKKDWKRLVRKLNGLGVETNLSVSLALTHCHFDHAENAAKFKRTYGAPILAHRSEDNLLRNGDNPVIKGTLRYTKILSGLLSSKRIASLMKYEPVASDVLVDDALRLEPYGIPGYLLHTPGHTSGSTSVVVDDEIAIVGDAMFGIFPNAVLPPFADNVSLVVRSWGKLLGTGCRIFLPAHGSERGANLVKSRYAEMIQRI